jgi:hypothetical protein
MENEWEKILYYVAVTREEHDQTLSLEKWCLPELHVRRWKVTKKK